MKSKKITIEDLATMVQAGFSEAEASVNKRFDKIEGDMAKGFKEIKDSQENIELKLTNVAYRFELVELQKRVELLEKKVLKS